MSTSLHSDASGAAPARPSVSTGFSQTGGIRVGEGIFNAFNATWPFAKLAATAKNLLLSCPLFGYSYSFPRESIRRLSRHRGLFSIGLRIEHSVAGYPVFLVFWTIKYAALKKGLQELGWEVDDGLR